MDEAIELSVVLPAYLEEENLRLLLPRVKAVLTELGVSTEVIVVDTHQPLDATEAVCEENGARYLQRQPGNAFGDAVRSGIAAARGNWLLFMDADGSHNPAVIRELWKQTPGNDVVIASRYVAGGCTENHRGLVFMSRVLNITYRVILGLNVLDVSNSFKVYKGELLRGLKLHCDNFDIIEEILYKIVRTNPNVRMKEIPFAFRKRMFGQTKRDLVAFMFTYLVTIVRLRFSTID